MKNVEDNRGSEGVRPDPRTKQDKGSLAQSDKPWEKNPQNTTDSGSAGTPKPDLENGRRRTRIDGQARPYRFDDYDGTPSRLRRSYHTAVRKNPP